MHCGKNDEELTKTLGILLADNIHTFVHSSYTIEHE